MMAIIRSLEAVEKSIIQTQSTPNTEDMNSTLIEGNQLYVANETVTMPKLHNLMMANSGVYLAIFDEVEGLFKSLEASGGPDAKDRRTWLSLHSGMPWARTSSKGRNTISDSRLNYTGKLYCDSAKLVLPWLSIVLSWPFDYPFESDYTIF